MVAMTPSKSIYFIAFSSFAMSCERAQQQQNAENWWANTCFVLARSSTILTQRYLLKNVVWNFLHKCDKVSNVLIFAVCLSQMQKLFFPHGVEVNRPLCKEWLSQRNRWRTINHGCSGAWWNWRRRRSTWKSWIMKPLSGTETRFRIFFGALFLQAHVQCCR